MSWLGYSFIPTRKPICKNRIYLGYELSDLSPESYEFDTYEIIESHSCNKTGRFYSECKRVKELNEKAKLYSKYRTTILYGENNEDNIKIVKDIEDKLINTYNFPII